MADKDLARFTLRVPKELLEKFGYIATYNGRTKNKELELMIKSRIKAFEEKVEKSVIEKDRGIDPYFFDGV